MHSEKPWKIDPQTGEIIAADGTVIGIIYGANGNPNDPDPGVREAAEQCRTNGRLVGAAPELLEACRAFVVAWKKSHQLEKTDVALGLAEQAIERAESNDPHN